MRVQTIVYVTEMRRSVDWYSRVLGVEPVTHGSHWSSFHVNGANLALHLADEATKTGAVEVSLVVTEPLEQFVARLDASGIAPAQGIVDETFGRSLRLRDPEGMTIQVNEHDPGLYEDH